jgi:NADPH-dependent 2,4-dienoyl-CoA reductase/sulfur reductase-like enzyme
MGDDSKRLLIIGGGAAGMSAAIAARRFAPEKEILVLERGPNVSFVLCGLPYFISGLVPNLNDLVVHTPQYFQSERNIEVRTGQDVKFIDAYNHSIELIDLPTHRKNVLSYEKLVIAAGAQPIVPSIHGLGLEGIFALRSLENAAAIKEFVGRKPVRKAAIIGAGYIGLEMAESLKLAGVKVTIIEAGPSILPGSEPEIAALIEAELQRQGVELLKSNVVLTIEPGQGPSVGRLTTDRGDIEADMVLVAAGARPDAAIARETGIDIGETGGIVTDEGMRTNVEGIFAAGDCVECRHLLTGRPIFLPLGTTANKQGRVAGENACGGNASFPGILGSLAFCLFDTEVARTGLSEDQARVAGFTPISATVQFPSRAEFYPDAGTLTVKLIAEERTGQLLGAQMAGKGSAAKRIDVVATAIQARMTVADLIHLDLAYTPPLGTTWEGIQLAAQELLRRGR